MSVQHDDAVLHSYVVATDSGFAPNTTNGTCTLATCKQVIRGEAKQSDWVLGTYPRDQGEDRITYLMRVGEVLTYDQYYSNGRFDFKKPENDPLGDNIYYQNEQGDLVQVENPPAHDDDSNRKKDKQSNSVLVADLFWYFGDQGPELPSELCEKVVKGYKSSSRSGRKKPSKHLGELIDWISERYEPGVHGEPRDNSGGSCSCRSKTNTSENNIC